MSAKLALRPPKGMPLSAVFDPLAPSYDADFTASPIAQHLRARVHDRLLTHFQAGARVLELGCGTGEDALFLAQQSRQVTATDASPAMLDITRAKLERVLTLNPPPLVGEGERGSEGIQLALLDLAHLPVDGFDDAPYAGAFANFGVLNNLDVAACAHLAEWLAPRIQAQGILAFAVMPPYCLWESLWHGLHGDLKTATRRWQGRADFQPAPTQPPVSIFYPTPRQLARAFAPHFRLNDCVPLGLCLPPSDVYGVLEQRPRLMRRLLQLDDTLGRRRAFAVLADHYWIEFIKN